LVATAQGKASVEIKGDMVLLARVQGAHEDWVDLPTERARSSR
jgi:hypothetical protein